MSPAKAVADPTGGSGKMTELRAQLRLLPRRTVVAVAAAHLLLLACIAWGGLHYVMVQLLLAVELLVFNLATALFYPKRGLGRHITDLLKMVAGLAFVLFFLVVTYGIVAEGDNGYALMAGLTALRGIGESAVAWTAFYIVVRMLVSLWQARTAPEPRIAWAQSVLAENAVTFIAMFLMVFATFFVGVPIMIALKFVGFDPSASVLLAGLMVALRFALTLVVATLPPHEMAAIAADPYLD
ncbi:MAG: hypothetical protein ABIO38_07175 [Luteimonas sp.]